MRTALPLVLVVASLSLPAQQMVAGPTLGPMAREAGDVDGDGHGDYTVQISPSTTTEVHSGRTRTVLPHLTFSSFLSYWPLFGDVDGDGCDDLVVGALVVSGRTGATLLAPPPNYGVFCAGDLDADGFDDLVLRVYRTGGLDEDLVLRSSRTGAVLLTQFVPFQQFSSLSWLRAYDVNGDGYDDFLELFFDSWQVTHSSSVRGGPTLVPLGINLSGSGLPLQPAGDTNGDGVRELARPGGEILHGTTLAPIWVTSPFVSSVSYYVQHFDIDGDGFDDVCGPSVGGAWSGRTHAALPGAPAGMVPLGDIDGDGRTEFASSGVLYEWQDPAMPRCSRAVRRGAAGATSSGKRPRITVRGSCVMGRTLFLDLRGGTPNGAAFLAWGGPSDLDLAVIGAPGNRAYIAPIDSIFKLGDTHGLVRHHFDVPVSLGLIGAGLSLQFGVFDAAANALGIVTSNAVDLEIHN